MQPVSPFHPLLLQCLLPVLLKVLTSCNHLLSNKNWTNYMQVSCFAVFIGAKFLLNQKQWIRASRIFQTTTNFSTSQLNYQLFQWFGAVFIHIKSFTFQEPATNNSKTYKHRMVNHEEVTVTKMEIVRTRPITYSTWESRSQNLFVSFRLCTEFMSHK